MESLVFGFMMLNISGHHMWSIENNSWSFIKDTWINKRFVTIKKKEVESMKPLLDNKTSFAVEEYLKSGLLKRMLKPSFLSLMLILNLQSQNVYL